VVKTPVAGGQIVAGCRQRYCSRNYFPEVGHIPKQAQASLHFIASRFAIEKSAGRSNNSEALVWVPLSAIHECSGYTPVAAQPGRDMTTAAAGDLGLWGSALRNQAGWRS